MSKISTTLLYLSHFIAVYVIHLHLYLGIFVNYLNFMNYIFYIYVVIKSEFSKFPKKSLT